MHNDTPISHYSQDSVDATYALGILVKNTEIISKKNSFLLSNFNMKGKGVQPNAKYFLQTPLWFSEQGYTLEISSLWLKETNFLAITKYLNKCVIEKKQD